MLKFVKIQCVPKIGAFFAENIDMSILFICLIGWQNTSTVEFFLYILDLNMKLRNGLVKNNLSKYEGVYVNTSTCVYVAIILGT